MAIEADTGKVRWARQLPPDDNHIDGCWRTGAARPANCPDRLGPDFAIGAAPILRALPGGGELLVVGPKSSAVHALDPAQDGAVVWQRRLGEGSALGGVEFGTAADGLRREKQAWVVGARPAHRRRGQAPADLARAPVPVGRLLVPRRALAGDHCGPRRAVFAGSHDGHIRAYDAETGRIVWDVDTASEPVCALNGRMVFGA